MKWLIALLKVERCNLAFSFLRIGWIMFLVIWHLSFFLLLVCSKHWSPVSHSRGILPGMESCSLQHAVIWSGEQLTCLSIFASEHIFSSLFMFTWVGPELIIPVHGSSPEFQRGHTSTNSTVKTKEKGQALEQRSGKVIAQRLAIKILNFEPPPEQHLNQLFMEHSADKSRII